jgi:anthranilate synthase component I
MKISPELEEFERLSEEADVVLVRAEFTADAETPLSAYAKLSTRKPAFLLESVVGGEQVSRYSFVGCNPRKVIACHEDETVVTERNGERNVFPTPADPLDIVEQEMAGIRYAAIDDLPRFAGGAVGYVGYEYASRIEPTVPLAEKDELGLPTLYFLIADLVLIFDHARQTLSICANAYVGDNPAADHAEAAERIADTVKQLSVSSPLLPAELDSVEAPDPPEGNFSKEEFEALVDQTKEYIRSGDAIQVVLSQRFAIPFAHSAIDLYRAIRAINPSPYMFLLESEDFSVVGASPEVHVRLTDDEVLIRPIAGTRPRGANEEEDQALEKELLADEKERAEHLMLVDLARNDIGRVCRHGTVQAAEYMIIERYSHVMHIVSQVLGKLDPGKNAFDLMRATFPAGTVSGAPKVRAMQIISESENLRRHVYAGALGHFGYDGNHDSCIAIRTAMLVDGMLQLQAGAGIVADSIPEMEYQETINKAKGMLKAIALAECQAGE